MKGTIDYGFATRFPNFEWRKRLDIICIFSLFFIIIPNAEKNSETLQCITESVSSVNIDNSVSVNSIRRDVLQNIDGTTLRAIVIL